MKVSKQAYGLFKGNEIYQAAAEDVAKAVERALGELLQSEDISERRRGFLLGFVEGIRSILDWEPDFIEDEESDLKDYEEDPNA